MADQYLQQLTAETAPAATDVVPISDNGTQRLRSLEYSYVGLEDTTGSDADTTMAAGKLYVVAMSGWATADRTYTLPVAASIATGQRIGIMISSGNASYELLIKSGAAGDLINGTDHSSTEWSRLFISGEVVILRCINGTTGDWVVEHDGRIPWCTAAKLTTDASGETAATWTAPTDASGAWTADKNVGSCFATSTGTLTARRAGSVQVVAQATPLNSVTDQQYLGLQLWDGSAGICAALLRQSGTSAIMNATLAKTWVAAASGTAQLRYITQAGSIGLDGALSHGPATHFSATEIL